MRRKIVLYSILIVAIVLSVYAENPRDMKFPPLKFVPPSPIRFQTDQGLTVFFLEDNELPVVTVDVFFHGGKVYDPADKAGLSEITARLVRSGGAGQRSPDQVDADLDFVGIDMSSNSSNDELSLNLHCLKKDIGLAFEIFSDMMTNPMFDSGKVALEISNAEDLIRRQNDEPGPITRRVFYQTVYTGHPYGIYPTLASMNSISRSDIMMQHKKYYCPDNAIMAVSGALTLDETKNLIGKYLGKWKKAGIKLAEPPMATARFRPGVYYAKKDINQAQIRLGSLCMDSKNPDRYAMDIMNFALGGGDFNSRLTKQVRTTAGLAYSVGSYAYNRPYMGSFFSFCLTKADAMGMALNMMLDIIRDVKEHGITQEEMELAQESTINSFVFNYDTPQKIASAAAYYELHGFPADQLEKDLEGYRAVTLQDCDRVAAAYLNTDSIAIVIVGNAALFDEPLDTWGPVDTVSMEIK
jgi:zinc protease